MIEVDVFKGVDREGRLYGVDRGNGNRAPSKKPTLLFMMSASISLQAKGRERGSGCRAGAMGKPTPIHLRVSS